MLSFRKKYDVCVVGAGIAGCSAAISAARRGLKVCLVEKQTLIGGLATSGLIYVYLPLCDGYGHQVTFGLSEELMKTSLKYSPFDLSDKWGGPKPKPAARGERYETEFSPSGFILSLDELLGKCGVDLWLESMILNVRMHENEVRAVEVANTSGVGLISAKCFVDASGEALLVRRAGGKYDVDENQNSIWFMEDAPDHSQYPWLDTLHIKAIHEPMPWLKKGMATDGKSATRYTRQAWDHIRRFYDENYRSGLTNRYNHFPVCLPAMNCFRKIAAARGLENLTDFDYGKRFENSVGMTGDWRKPGPVWETPFGALIPEKIQGVYTCGRCMGTTGLAWEIYRVIPSAAMTGEAAGLAAALSVEQDVGTHELKAESVQNALRERGVKLHIDEAVPGGYDFFRDKLPAGVKVGAALEDGGKKK